MGRGDEPGQRGTHGSAESNEIGVQGGWHTEGMQEAAELAAGDGSRAAPSIRWSRDDENSVS